MKKVHYGHLIVILTGIFLLAACSSDTSSPSKSGKLKILATTTIVGDVVSQVGGDLVAVDVLLPTGTDPHSFDPTPQDVAQAADADLVFANGAGLEEFLNPLIQSANAENKVVYVSDGIDFLVIGDEIDHGDGSLDEGNLGGRQPAGVDPHTWTDPGNVRVWVDNIQRKLSQVDPANAQTYRANAEKYSTELQGLDEWIREQVARIPQAHRNLVVDHMIFGYYAEAYGFKQVGTIILGFSTLAAPSAQELAAIEDTINQFNVKAIFVGKSVNSSLAERIAEDTHTDLVSIYTGSLSDPGQGAGTYLEYMRYNTTAFVEALQ